MPSDILDLANHAEENAAGWFELLSASNPVTIDLPFRRLGTAQYAADIAHDYLEIAFVAEELASVSSKASFEIHHRRPDKPFGAVRLCLHDLQAERASTFLARFGLAFMGSSDFVSADQLEDANVEFEGEIDDFQSRIDTMNLAFPALCDEYMANFVEALAERDDEEQESSYPEHPEYDALFWRSFVSRRLGFDVFLSSDNVFVTPAFADLDSALGALELAEQQLEPMNEAPSAVVRKWSKKLARGKACVDAVWTELEGRTYRHLVNGSRTLLIAVCDEARIVVVLDGKRSITH